MTPPSNILARIIVIFLTICRDIISLLLSLFDGDVTLRVLWARLNGKVPSDNDYPSNLLLFSEKLAQTVASMESKNTSVTDEAHTDRPKPWLCPSSKLCAVIVANDVDGTKE